MNASLPSDEPLDEHGTSPTKLLKRGEFPVDDDSVSTDELERQVESTLHGFEEGFRTRHPGWWLTTLIVPPLLLIGAVIVTWIWTDWVFTVKLVGAATVTFFGLGRFVILFGQQPQVAAPEEFSQAFEFLSPTQLFVMVTYMDFAVALLVAFHIGAMFRLPWLGKRVAGLVEDARFVLDSMPWMRRLAFIGMTLFVAFPLAATGAIGGSILGTLLGLSRMATFLATVIGCLLGNSLLFLASDIVARFVDTNHPVVRFGGLGAIILLIIVMEVRYKRQKQKFHDAHEHPDNAAPE